MRLSRKLVLKAYEELKKEMGEVTQYDVHYKISELLGRQLRIGEKRRITYILKDEIGVKEERKDSEYRIFIF